MLTLTEAIKTGRLLKFINEQTSLHGSIDRQEFDNSVSKIVKAPRPRDQTSGLPERDGSSGKKTR